MPDYYRARSQLDAAKPRRRVPVFIVCFVLIAQLRRDRCIMALRFRSLAIFVVMASPRGGETSVKRNRTRDNKRRRVLIPAGRAGIAVFARFGT